MLGQGFDELVDFAFGVVDVGAGAEAAARLQKRFRESSTEGPRADEPKAGWGGRLTCLNELSSKSRIFLRRGSRKLRPEALGWYRRCAPPWLRNLSVR